MYSNPEPPDEMLQIFDEEGNRTDALPRAIANAEPRKHWCGVVNVWLVNAQGEVLCSKRADTLSGNPGKWQTYFGGHVKAGQSFVDAAISEMDEEVGVQIDPKKLFLVSKAARPQYLRHFESYAYPFDGEISALTFNDGEIVDSKWMSIPKYLKDRETNPDHWCNGISEESKASLEEWIRAGR